MLNIGIIGGGASGIFSAICLAKYFLEAQKRVTITILERQHRLGRKILVSGNGHCNVHNANTAASNFFSLSLLNRESLNSIEDYLCAIQKCKGSAFVDTILKNLNFKEFCEIFSSLGISLITQQDNRVFPLSKSAKSFVYILEQLLGDMGVKVILEAEVHKIQPLKKIKVFYRQENNQKALEFDVLLLACGSLAAPHISGTSLGLELAKNLGHTINEIKPSLVPLRLHSNSCFNALVGVKIFANGSLLLDGKQIVNISGDFLFTSYGISGFASLDLSCYVAILEILGAKNLKLRLNLIPHLSKEELSRQIKKWTQGAVKKDLEDILYGLLPPKLANHFTKILQNNFKGIWDTKTIYKIVYALQNWHLDIEGVEDFKYAEASMGGVNCKEVDWKTLESKKVSKIYFAGEMLDVLGARGGFNFAFAWASARVCAKSIFEKYQSFGV